MNDDNGISGGDGDGRRRMHVQLQAAHQGMAQEAAGQLAKIFAKCRSVCAKRAVEYIVRNKEHRHKSAGRRRRQGYVHQHHSLLHELLFGFYYLELRSRLEGKESSKNPGYSQ